MNVSNKDIVWTYLSRFFSFGVNLLILPLILRFLTDVELGLWYVFASISQIVNLFDFGFSAAISRHMTYAWSGATKLEKKSVPQFSLGKPNDELISKVFRTCQIVYLIIAFLAFLSMISFGTMYIYKVADDDLTVNTKIAWYIYTVSIFLNLFYGYWNPILQGMGAITEKSKIGVFSKIIQIFLATGLLITGNGLLGFVIAYTLCGFSIRFMGRYYFRKKTSCLTIIRNIEIADIKDCFTTVWATAWKDGVVMLAQYFSTQANTMLCAYFIDLSTTSSYGIINQIGSFLASVAAAYFSSYQAKCNNACALKNRDELRHIICDSLIVYKIIYVMGVIAFFTMGIPLLYLIRPNLILNMSITIAVLIFYYLYNQHCLTASIIASSNELPFTRSFLITALVSFVVSFLLIVIFDLGIYGLIIGQLICNAVYNNWKWPRTLLKNNELRYVDIYKIGLIDIKNKVYSFVR